MTERAYVLKDGLIRSVTRYGISFATGFGDHRPLERAGRDRRGQFRANLEDEATARSMPLPRACGGERFATRSSRTTMWSPLRPTSAFESISRPVTHQRGTRDDDSRVVAAERTVVLARRPLVVFRAHQHERNRYADGFRQADNVGHDPCVLKAEKRARVPAARLDFIDEQLHTEPTREFGEHAQPHERSGVDAAFGLHCPTMTAAANSLPLPSVSIFCSVAMPHPGSPSYWQAHHIGQRDARGRSVGGVGGGAARRVKCRGRHA